LNTIAAAVISTTNSTSSTPVFTGTGAADIAVIATSATISAGAGGAAADNSVALAMAAQRGGSADTGYSGLVGTIGSDVANAQNASITSASVLTSLDARRQSVSGVSMDEEMANLVKFQRGYQAAARALSTMDDVLDTLINSTGI
jgi:flagellar hook-associated protein 1